MVVWSLYSMSLKPICKEWISAYSGVVFGSGVGGHYTMRVVPLGQSIPLFRIDIAFVKGVELLEWNPQSPACAVKAYGALKINPRSYWDPSCFRENYQPSISLYF